MKKKASTIPLTIYEINSGVREWVAARSPIEALQVLCRVTGIDLMDFDWTDEIREVPEEFWNQYHVADESGVVLLTFAEWMQCHKEPDMIATTTY